MTDIKRSLRIGRLAASLAAVGAVSIAAPASATIDLTPDDRVVIYRSVIEAPPPPPPAAFEAEVGAVVPEEVELYEMPAAVEVAPARDYRYVVIERRVVLVDPRTREVIEVIEE